MDGLIIPDLPPEEARELETLTQQCQLDLIYLLAPNSSEERIELVAGKSQGFIYLVSVTGVTGARERLPVDLENFVLRVRGKASQPLCVGFGISTSAQAHQITKVANGIIVGSRLIQLLEQPSFAELEKFIRSLRKAL
jgi:tryptophan synthase alpha chain